MPWKTEKIAIRIRPDIKRAAQIAAHDNQRSLSSYIEAMLTEALAKDSYLKAARQRELPGLSSSSRPGGLIRHGS